ncbi:MAG: FHA domain-containing protein [Muribaculaceae bacterium]|nr:FHA domain-containing protein [Muribaculaceae bacterium]
MKEIECPSCGEMIPDDSKYCDQCGAELLECVNCGALGTDDFCAECGKPMVSKGKVEKKPDTTVKTTKEEEDLVDYGNTTVGGRIARIGLVLKARKGHIQLRPQDEAIIGRSDSPYEHLLSNCNLISRKHAKFEKRGRDWYIVDLGSTNGTLINDVELQPGTPMKFQEGDVVDLGTYIFDVIVG